MKKSVLLFSTVLVMLFLTSCEKGLLIGSGNEISEDRALAVFDKITNFGSIDVKILHGNAQLVTVNTDDNIIDHVETTVSGNVLEIDMERGVSYTGTAVTIEITIPDLKRIKNKGSGDIRISNFEDLDKLEIRNDGSGNIDSRNIIVADCEINNGGSGDLEWEDFVVRNCMIHNNGSGDLELDGNVKNLDIRNHGSGNFHLFSLESKNCDIKNNGSGNLKIRCTDQLDIVNNGSGNVYYKGDPLSVTRSNNGSGKIVKRD